MWMQVNQEPSRVVVVPSKAYGRGAYAAVVFLVVGVIYANSYSVDVAGAGFSLLLIVVLGPTAIRNWRTAKRTLVVVNDDDRARSQFDAERALHATDIAAVRVRAQMPQSSDDYALAVVELVLRRGSEAVAVYQTYIQRKRGAMEVARSLAARWNVPYEDALSR